MGLFWTLQSHKERPRRSTAGACIFEGVSVAVPTLASGTTMWRETRASRPLSLQPHTQLGVCVVAQQTSSCTGP